MVICDIAQFHSPLGGGVKRYLQDKRLRLEARGQCRHVLIIPSYRNHVTAAPGGHAVYEIESVRLPGSKSYRMLLNKPRIMEAVLREKPDLIEVGDPYRTAWIGLAAGRQLRIPVVAFYHSDFPRALDRTIVRFSGQLIAHGLSAPIRRYIHGLYNQMDATIVASRRLAATLRKGGIRNIEHIALGTDTAQFRPRSSRERVRAEFGVAPKAQLLLFVGRLAREKGIKQLIAAIDMLPADLPVHLALVGDGELDSWVHLEANRRPNLTWLPYCESSDRLADIYSAADLFVHAGRWETFGIVSLEAQACGTPVVAVRGGGLEESLSCESPPSLAAEGTPVALANAIELRLRRHTESPAQRIARHHAICERFSIDRTFSRIFELYERLIGGNRHKQRIASATPQQVGPAGVR